MDRVANILHILHLAEKTMDLDNVKGLQTLLWLQVLETVGFYATDPTTFVLKCLTKFATMSKRGRGIRSNKYFCSKDA